MLKKLLDRINDALQTRRVSESEIAIANAAPFIIAGIGIALQGLLLYFYLDVLAIKSILALPTSLLLPEVVVLFCALSTISFIFWRIRLTNIYLKQLAETQVTDTAERDPEIWPPVPRNRNSGT